MAGAMTSALHLLAILLVAPVVHCRLEPLLGGVHHHDKLPGWQGES